MFMSFHHMMCTGIVLVYCWYTVGILLVYCWYTVGIDQYIMPGWDAYTHCCRAPLDHKLLGMRRQLQGAGCSGKNNNKWPSTALYSEQTL